MAARLPKLAPPMHDTSKPREGAFHTQGNWTREQTILAFYFYCQTPFGQLHGKNKKIIELAAIIGRTPGALAMKCVNIANIDPAIRESGRAGLSNASALDREIWTEFHTNWDGLVTEAEGLLAHSRDDRGVPSSSGSDDFAEIDFTGATRLALVKQRVGQAFFRKSVLTSYGGKCCVSGVSDRRFLVASHIVAWNEDAAIRLHPGNGLCLSAIHDKAFDCHLFSLTNDHRIILSSQLRRTPDDFLREVFGPMDGKKIVLPEKFVPEVAFIQRHREKMQELER